MQIDKANLLKTLRQVAGFDPLASPYVAVEFVAGKPQFYRSSGFGFVYSKDILHKHVIYVSLNDLRERLAISEDKVEMLVDRNNVLRLDSVDVYATTHLIHTVGERQAGMKTHTVGAIQTRLDPQVFRGLDMSPFKQLSSQPVLTKGKLMLATQSGVFMWSTPQELASLNIHPRDSFLRVVTSSVPEEIVVTANKYWGATSEELVTFVASNYAPSLQLFNQYDVSSTEVARIPALRLISSLTRASSICGDSDKVEFDPKQGVVVHPGGRAPSNFTLGASGWTKFALSGRSARMVAECLRQDNETEDIVLSTLPTANNPTMRFRRGNYEINVKTISK